MTMNMGGGQFGDTTLTKVFVGGLAWETQKDYLKEHFEKYGEILEAVIISDKVTGRSKGYGFVTFKEAEAAKKACEDATPTINGRRANCNLASLGARRPRTAPAQQHQGGTAAGGGSVNGCNVGPRATSAAQANHVQWYYPTGTHASPYHAHHAVPFHAYGYSPAYVTADMGYNQKMGYNGGSYVSGHYSHVYPGQGMMGGNTITPVYPVYQFHHHHQSQTMGLPAHVYPPTTAAGHVTAVPTIISKPPAMAPNAGTGALLKGGIEKEANKNN
ncbi:hypothetical protein Sjap_001622 [Stephania japonica]|uniref:RRM domain-containing protein n=1 Tax=Stephania japonica TaxID=461633 RepID=A0AAP0KML4_9MAGN